MLKKLRLSKIRHSSAMRNRKFFSVKAEDIQDIVVSLAIYPGQMAKEAPVALLSF